MPSLRIQGVVRVANALRRELARPVTASRKEQLRQLADDTIRQVDSILRSHNAQIKTLPAPTRRAYAFLKSLDFDSVAASPDKPENQTRGQVSFPGLARHWEALLHALGQATDASKGDSVHAAIRRSSRNIERQMEARKVEPHQLSAVTRAIRGWLAFFADREHFDAYQAAVGRARPVLEASLGKSDRFRPPFWVEFRPMSGIYRFHRYTNGTQIALPTPMITFSAEQFALLAAVPRDGAPTKAQLIRATLEEDYQTIQAELVALGGIEELTGGLHHDLKESFERVNRAHFAGAMSTPRLVWSKVFTGRLFGHYDRIRDMVMISCTLDQADVPAFVLDFVVYHELLHKKLGVVCRNGRMASHTPAFRSEERRFERFDEADALLKKLAGGIEAQSNANRDGPAKGCPA